MASVKPVALLFFARNDYSPLYFSPKYPFYAKIVAKGRS